MAVAEASGKTGSWFAMINKDGVPVPCVHECWVAMGSAGKGVMRYHDPFPVKDWDKIPEYLKALGELKRAILTRDKLESGRPVKRDGYIAEFAIDEVEWSDDEGLSFRFVKRLRDLK